MKVGITGASGFVGGAIARAFERSGWSVARFGRRAPNHYELSAPVAPEALDGLDALVHAAYAPDADNVAAVVRLRSAARAARVASFTFISSFAASADARSTYGREKFHAESQLDAAQDLIVRPGLVTGDGGLYGSMRRTISRIGIAPVFGDGLQPVYLVEADELGRAVVALVAGGARGVYPCASAEPISFRDLCEAIGLAAGRRARCVPIPVGVALGVIGLAESLGIRPPVSSESVRGIANLREVDVATYPQIGFTFSPPRDAVRRAEAGPA